MALNEVAREYFWGCVLSKDSPTMTWSFEEEDEDTDYLIHTLFLKQAVLGSAAVKDERNVVEVEAKNFDNQSVKHPIVSLTLGSNEMTMLDLSFGQETPVIFKLIEGSGPVHLLAQQLVEYPDEQVENQLESELETDDGLEETEEDEEEEEEEEKAPVKSKKRKASSTKSSKAKKGKMAESEEDMEDDDDDDEEDEEDDDDDDDDDEEEEESPKKVVKKKKENVSKGKANKKKNLKTTKASPGRLSAKAKKASGKRGVKA